MGYFIFVMISEMGLMNTIFDVKIMEVSIIELSKDRTSPLPLDIHTLVYLLDPMMDQDNECGSPHVFILLNHSYIK